MKKLVLIMSAFVAVALCACDSEAEKAQEAVAGAQDAVEAAVQEATPEEAQEAVADTTLEAAIEAAAADAQEAVENL